MSALSLVPSPAPPEDLARESWRSSGISDEAASLLGYRHLSPEDVGKLGRPFDGSRSALLIPYFKLDGSPDPYFRVRYLSPPTGWRAAQARPQRYACPLNSKPEVYLPPLIDWAGLSQDPTERVYLTEGEKKASAASERGLPCVGLGGVDSWRSAKRGIALLPALEQFVWTNREVVIIFDSDAATNPNVVRAQTALAHELLARGARPSVVALPTADDGSKVGLDDYLLTHTPEEVEALVLSSPAYQEARALWEMSADVLYVRRRGIVVVREDGRLISPADYTGHQFSNRSFTRLVTTQQGIRTRTFKTASEWLDWPSRAEVYDVTYAPGQPQEVEDNWNTWTGWGCEPKEGDNSVWDKFLDYLFASDPAYKEWILDWAAHKIQNPRTKPYTAPIIWGSTQGTGKTLFFYALLKIHGANGVEVGSEDLKAPFNGYMVNKTFVYGDEVTAGESRQTADKLKQRITSHRSVVKIKYVPEYEVPDLASWGFTSNHNDSFYVEDSDRRFAIHEAPLRPLPPARYVELDAWLKGDGPAIWMDKLLKRDVSGYSPTAHAPRSDAKEQMILSSRSELAAWVALLQADPEQALAPLGKEVAQGAQLLTSEQMLRAYDPSQRTKVGAQGIGRAVKQAGIAFACRGRQVRTPAGVLRLVCVRSPERWTDALPTEAAQEYDRTLTLMGGKF
jgi:hypothetical protein